ncbi:MAG: division/cell wall cluster transcriptional repressor MraZ [candidate division KSB1 bacterium]|nr:division/cell wall cluster transcriptional repressor MraZ [candidate division KSB1 bacterium]MDZ7377820.1 division/cell wall cluster transcriptional repressor MraZ [candidate division KSB1 bacterium]MDZ7385482.1 division/cell wall cluster transcriptional repressor MraZ [candidate division KSB1 bacterium]MDZ7393803.1 division/cell wall cluster transcriptional repressor MraZ [candidate division KSB1 bacterium]MDZ7414395.1 division/cell wall cluster transcriptional repressor MraZ [candidate div
MPIVQVSDPSQPLYTEFQGHSRVTVDQKGRLSIPAKFRALLSPESREGLILMQGIEPCIYAYPIDEWARLTKLFEGQWSNLKDKYRFNRRWAMLSTLVQFDPQGRIALPGNLRDYAQIEGEAIVGGVVDHLEIWKPALFMETVQGVEIEFGEMFGNLGGTGKAQVMTNETHQGGGSPVA